MRLLEREQITTREILACWNKLGWDSNLNDLYKKKRQAATHVLVSYFNHYM